MPFDQCTLERIRCGAEQRQLEAERFRQEVGQQQAAAEYVEAPPRPGLAQILRSHDFSLLWGGQFASLLGDQLFLVALPWLVLQLTGSAFAIGTVVAVAAAPRTIFILLGGALIDRFSPLTVMLYSNVVRVALMAVLVLLTLTEWLELWMLFPFGFLIGLGYALYLPAQSAIVPRLVPEDRLQTGNAIIQGTAQLSLFLGPLVAGLLIGFLARNGSGTAAFPHAPGIALVFGLTGIGFFISAFTLTRIGSPLAGIDRSGGTKPGGVFRSLGKAMAEVWRDKALRLYLALIAVVNIMLLGAVSVGIPVLAATRFSGGAIAYGSILAGVGAGALLGVVAAGILPRAKGRSFAVVMIGSTTVLGMGLSLLGLAPSAGLAVAAAFVIGLAEGYVIVEFITWLQLRTSSEELGRMMSILLFFSIGMAPISNLIAGALLQLTISVFLIAAGGLIVLVALLSALSPSVRRLGEGGAQDVRD